jgi:hypothetical protein
MRRREFIAGLGSAAAWPLAARAQQPERVRHIGVLMNVVKDDPGGLADVAAFRQGLAELGWVGKQVAVFGQYEPRTAHAPELPYSVIPNSFLITSTATCRSKCATCSSACTATANTCWD